MSLYLNLVLGVDRVRSLNTEAFVVESKLLDACPVVQT